MIPYDMCSFVMLVLLICYCYLSHYNCASYTYLSIKKQIIRTAAAVVLAFVVF